MNPKHTTGPPADRRTATKRWTAGDRGDHCRPAAIDWSPDENLVIWGENWPVAEQSPGGDHQVTAGWVYNILFKVNKIARWATDLEISQSAKNRLIAQLIKVYWDVAIRYCDSFAEDNDVKYNAKKTVYVCQTKRT